MNFLLLISVGLFALACCLPALEFKNSSGPNDIMFGLRALAVGWSGLFAAVLSWYANPLWLAGVILCVLKKQIPTVILGVLAIAISLTTFAVVGRELPGDEGNVTKTTVIKLLPGCYVWLASLILLPLSAFIKR